VEKEDLWANTPFLAVLWATVAASFTIEQSGLPTLEKREGVELWNGDVPRERIETLRHRLAAV
jgi:hypothetical protein